MINLVEQAICTYAGNQGATITGKTIFWDAWGGENGSVYSRRHICFLNVLHCSLHQVIITAIFGFNNA